MTRYVALGALSLMLFGAPDRAAAHDPPDVMRIAWVPGASEAAAVFQTNRGFIVGDTQSRSYRWACAEGLALGLGEQPGFVILPGDVWMVATEHGLLTSSDQGCTWSATERFGMQVSSAVEQLSDAPEHVLLTIAGAADGGLYESRDAGKSWQKRLHLGPDDYVTQIRVAPSDPARIYLNGLVFDEQNDKFSFQLTRSSDAGATWARVYVPLGFDEDQAVLAAVSPSDPDSLLVLARNHRWGEVPDRALYSADAGETYRELARGVKLTGATFSADGAAIVLAGGESLVRIQLDAATPELIGMSQMLTCAQPGPGGLYACGHVNRYDPIQYGAAISTDDGVTFSSLMSFTEVMEQVECADQAVAKQCSDQWIDWQLEILVGLGGAAIDSVEGWMDFRGIEEVEHPAPAHTLSTAKRSMSAATSGNAPAADGSSEIDAVGENSAEKPAEANTGCQGVALGARRDAAWSSVAALLLGVYRLCRRRLFTL
jgi:hypothetical protein